MDKKGLIGTIVVAGILLVVGFFWFVGELDFEEECVRVETGCCPCANGGEEICVLESEVKKIEDAKNCSGDVFCVAVYVCEIVSCEYLEGECVAR